jgi:putative copper resistance protein D
VAGFLDVVLRGLAQCGQAMAIGGVLFAVVALRPAARRAPEVSPLLGRTLGLIAAGAAGVIAAQSLTLLAPLWLLADERGWPLRDALSTTYFRASLLRMAACLGLITASLALRRRGTRRGAWLALVLLSAVLGGASAWISHAAARLEGRSLLLALDAVHQIAVAAWVGGLVHLGALAFGRRDKRPWPMPLLQRFSALSLTAVAVLVAAGVGLTVHYVDGPYALLGTAYGLMVLTKVAILGGLLALGALNFLAVRRLPRAGGMSQLRLRRFVEVELGLGITVLFAATSLTSLPPAVDVVADRATLAEVALRFTPRWPTLESPAIHEMPVDDPDAPRTDADRAWSEYNHHMAGLFVLAMGLLALLHATGHARWARHWPLIFLGLAAFLLVRNDPGAWPLGPQGFWEGFAQPSVLQHRLFVLLVVSFGIFEWAVRSGRLPSPRLALIFPLLCALGGGLLLTHSHASLNLKDEFLIEVTHAPLGVLALAVGWGRWLELRLPSSESRWPGRIWAVAFTLIGVLLLLYRES